MQSKYVKMICDLRYLGKVSLNVHGALEFKPLEICPDLQVIVDWGDLLWETIIVAGGGH